jgi:purine-cytosine permease-like protein
VILNGGYLIFVAYFMHRRILKKEKWRWYSSDLAIPLLAAIVSALVCRSIIPANLGRFSEFLALLVGALAVLMAAAFAASVVRLQMIQFIRSKISPIFRES